MAAGKHTRGRHSAPRGKGGRKEFSFPRGPKDPQASDTVEVPEEIAKTAAGRMQTVGSAHDERPSGEASTGATLDEWVEGQAPEPDAAMKSITRKGKLAIAVVVAAAVLAVAALVFVALYRPVSTPSQVTRAALEAIKADDFGDLGDFYAGDAPKLQGTLEGSLAAGADFGSRSQLEGKLNDEQKQTLAQFDQQLLGFDYSLGQETANGDSATVEVTFTTYDFGAFSQDVLGSYIADGLEASSKGDLESSADAATRFVRELRDHAGELGAKDRQATTELSLVAAPDGTWKLSELTTDNLDALTGGLVSTTGKMAAQLESGQAE